MLIISTAQYFEGNSGEHYNGHTEFKPGLKYKPGLVKRPGSDLTVACTNRGRGFY